MTKFDELYGSIDTYCGLSCTDCEFKESMNCGGCIATGGKPFHGRCDVAKCAVSRGKKFCGECPDFPCELLKGYSEDPEHGDTPPGARIENCSGLKAAMVKAARDGIDPQGVCGHHCDHCPYTQWCGGCRSQYPGCSFATLYEDRRCPNTVCAGERGVDGCYDCPELESCQKGYFGAGDGYNAKGAALFISRHGKESYAAALGKNAERPEGIDTPEGLAEFFESIE